MSDDLETFLEGKRVFVTGVCGTIGRALLERLMNSEAASIVGSDHNEGALFELAERIDDPRVRLILGDVQDRHQLAERLAGIDLVIHTAAFKHVGTCERSPRDAVSVNVLATQNIIDAARSVGVGRVVLTSSDKAVNPTSVMGTSKLLSERLVAAAAESADNNGPVFTITRFGNVLGSSGSVVRVFERQIAQGGPVTLTDKRMTRFVMAPGEAVDLVLDSARRARGGELFVTKMGSLRIPDLASAMIGLLAERFGQYPEGIPIEEVGSRAGEKLYEELLNSEELRRTVELDDFFVVLPALAPDAASRLAAYHGGGTERTPTDVYRSDCVDAMSREAITRYIDNPSIIGAA